MSGRTSISARLRYEDYLLFPDDGKRHEIIAGDHFMTPAPSTQHQRVCFNIARQIDAQARQSSLGMMLIAPVDVLLSEEDIVQPDVIFVSAARASIITEKNVAGPPDLAVEVLSEGTRRKDVVIKRKLYERFGVREYWIVDPELESVTVYRAGEDGYERTAELSLENADSLATPLLPGLALPLAAIFG